MDIIKVIFQKIEDGNLWVKQLTLERNEFLKVSGSTDTNLYYVVKGSLRIFISGESEEHTIRFGYKNNFIAALDSFITERPSDLFIQAIKSTQLRVISKKNYLALMNSTTENAELWNKILEQLVVEQMEREQDILIASPTERYKRVLKRSPRLFQKIPDKYIASYLRMTPETLSRIKKS